MSSTPLFTTNADTPTVALSSSRVIVGDNDGSLSVFFVGSDSRIKVSRSNDGGVMWSKPVDAAIDGSDQFSVALSDEKVHLIYISMSRGIKQSVFDSKGELSLPDPKSVYLYHEETGVPSFPSVCPDGLGGIHVACSFKGETGWRVLYSHVDRGDWNPWEVVDQGDWPSTSYCSVAMTDDGIVHVIYRANVAGRYQLFHRSREASGWSPSVQLTSSNGHNGTPCLEVDGTSLHAVWARSDEDEAGTFIVSRRYLNGLWGGETKLSESGADANYPSSVAYSGFIAVGWENQGNLVCRASFDWGNSWGPTVDLMNEGNNLHPKVGVGFLSVDGEASFFAAWTKAEAVPWMGTSGVSVAKFALDRDCRLTASVTGLLEDAGAYSETHSEIGSFALSEPPSPRPEPKQERQGPAIRFFDIKEDGRRAQTEKGNAEKSGEIPALLNNTTGRVGVLEDKVTAFAEFRRESEGSMRNISNKLERLTISVDMVKAIESSLRSLESRLSKLEKEFSVEKSGRASYQTPASTPKMPDNPARVPPSGRLSQAQTTVRIGESAVKKTSQPISKPVAPTKDEEPAKRSLLSRLFRRKD